MKNPSIILASAMLIALPGIALAQSGTTTGAVGGAVTGAIVGGPVGAVVGGVIGAVAGTALSPPPAEVRTYVVSQKVPSYAYGGEVMVGRPVGSNVVLYEIPNAPTYSYTYINDRYVVVDPKTRNVVTIYE